MEIALLAHKRVTRQPPKRAQWVYKSTKKRGDFYFFLLSFVRACLGLEGRREDKLQSLSTFEAGLSTKDLLNQFTTRNGMQALLRNISQRSTEKGSLEAEAGDVSVKMEMEDGRQGSARRPLPGNSSAFAAPRPFQHTPPKEGQNAFSGPHGWVPTPAWKSDFPDPLPRTPHPWCLPRGGRQQRNKEHWEAPSWASASTICKFHRWRRQRRPQTPLNLKNRGVRGRPTTSAGPPWG